MPSFHWSWSNIVVLFLGAVFFVLFVWWLVRWIVYVWQMWWWRPRASGAMAPQSSATYPPVQNDPYDAPDYVQEYVDDGFYDERTDGAHYRGGGAPYDEGY